jgi:hypothetical protein
LLKSTIFRAALPAFGFPLRLLRWQKIILLLVWSRCDSYVYRVRRYGKLRGNSS